MPVVALVNTKGGVGKTTSAILLAQQAIAHGYSARVLDSDPQGTSTKWSYAVQDAGTALTFDVQPANAGTIDHLSVPENEWVFIDTPPGQSEAIKAAISRADFIIVPTTPATADLWQTLPTTTVLSDKPFGVLITQARTNTILLRDFIGLLTENHLPYFENTIPLRESIKDAVGRANLTHVSDEYAAVFTELAAVIKD